MGKGNKRPLVHGDIIGVLQNLDSFRFLKKDEQEDDFKKNLPIKIKKKYVIDKLLGSGANGKVYLGFSKSKTENWKKYAVKIIRKDATRSDYGDSSESDINKEVEIMKKIKHNCIIRIIEVLETEKILAIVLELAEGGELF